MCAHAGGPLDKGTLVDGCVECPWHGSRFRLADGHVARGPAVYDQPVFEVRAKEEGGLEARRAEARRLAGLRVEVLQELVRGELDLLVAPLGRSEVARDDP